jgi:hypothetical protein
MKKGIPLLAVAVLLSFQLAAQTQTLFDNAEVRGAFGGPFVEVSEINAQTGVSVGGGGALVINNFFVGGYGMGTQFPTVQIEQFQDYIDFGHGGFWLGYTATPYKLLHVYSDVKIGWGKARIKETRDADDEEAFYTDPFFTVLPQLGIELNVADFFKIGFTGGYRFVTGINELPGGLSDDRFSSPIGTITFRFGGFADNGWDDDDDWDDWDD